MSGTDGRGSDPLPLSLACWVDRQCDAFEAAWRAGERPRVEEFLGDLAEPGRSTLLRELLAAEIELRHAAGEHPVPQDYTVLYAGLDSEPQARSQLDALFWEMPGSDSVLDGLGSLSTLPRESGSGPPGKSAPPRIAGYEIATELGRGAMGAVYLARQVRLNRPCALKVILAGTFATPDSIRRFLTEAETTAQLQHPNIVRIHATGDFDERPYFELEFVDGGTLQDRLDGTPWRPRDAAALVEQLARALHAAHERGIVHRDIKPANILMTRDGVPKIADFGLAKSLDQEGLTQSGAIVGTPSYMSPEQAGGRSASIGPPADLYALGALLYELLTGRPPFKGISIHDTLHQVRSAEPVSPAKLTPGLPRDLEVICLKCLEKEPERRFETAGELADELTRFLEHRPIRTRPVSTAERAARWCRRNPSLAIVGGLGMAALVAAVAGWIGFGIYQYHASLALRQALLESETRSAKTTLDLAQSLCEAGNEERGLLQMGLGLQIAHHAESPVLERAARASIARWREQVPRLQGFFDHGAEIELLAVSPDGRLAATAGVDQTARVWDSQSGELRHATEYQGKLRQIDFSPDSRRFLIVASNRARLVDAAGGGVIATFIHPDVILAAAISPDGSMSLTAGDEGTAQRWDTATGQAIGAPLKHDEAIQVAAFSPDGARLVTGSRDGKVRVWDVKNGSQVGNDLNHGSPVTCVGFSPDSRQIAVGLDSGAARLWDATAGRALSPPLQHKGAVERVVFHPNGRLLGTAGRDWKARLWKIEGGRITGAAPVIFDHGAPVTTMKLSPDGQKLLTASRDSKVRIWSLKGEIQHVVLHPAAVWGASFLADGQSLIVAGQDPHARSWKLPADQPEGVALDHPGDLYTVAFRPDGAVLATGGGAHVVRLWEMETGRLAGELPHDGEIFALCFSPDGRFLAVVCDSKLLWWDLAEKRVRHVFEHPYVVSSVVVSPDGRRVVTGSRDGLLTLWDVASGTQVGAVSEHKGPIWALAYAPSGDFFLSGSADQRVIVWDGRTGRPTPTSWRHQGQVWTVAFGASGRTAIAGSDDNTVRLWNLDSPSDSSVTLHQSEPVRSLLLARDNHSLIVGGRADHVACWDTEAQLRIGPLLAHGDPVLASYLRESGGGFTLWTVSEDKRLHRWAFAAFGAEPIERLILELQVTTGMELHAGSERFIDVPAWYARSKQLGSRK